MSSDREVFDLLSDDEQVDDNEDDGISDLGESRANTAPSSPFLPSHVSILESDTDQNSRSWFPSFLSQSSALAQQQRNADDDNFSVASAASASTANSYNSKQAKVIKRKKPNTSSSAPINVLNKAQIQTIAMVVEESLLTSEFIEGLSKEFMDVAISSSQQHLATANNAVQNRPGSYGITASHGEVVKKYTYVSVTTPLAGLIHWIRCDNHRQLQLLLNDSNVANDGIVDEYGKFKPYFENITLIVLNNDDFCEKLIPKAGTTVTAEDSCFELLDEWIHKTIQKLKKQQPAANTASRTHHVEYMPRLILAMIDIDKTALKVQRKLNKNNIGISMQTRIDEAIVHLAIEHDIEVFRCKKYPELSEYLHTVTRVLENPIEKENLNAFDCVMKASKQKMPDGLTEEQQYKFELRQTWVAMLQMIPLLSKEKAVALANTTEFSSVKRVYESMNNEEEPEKKRMTLLQSAFGKTKGGVVRNETKLSTHIFKMMTTKDPDALLQDD